MYCLCCAYCCLYVPWRQPLPIGEGLAAYGYGWIVSGVPGRPTETDLGTEIKYSAASETPQFEVVDAPGPADAGVQSAIKTIRCPATEMRTDWLGYFAIETQSSFPEKNPTAMLDVQLILLRLLAVTAVASAAILLTVKPNRL